MTRSVVAHTKAPWLMRTATRYVTRRKNKLAMRSRMPGTWAATRTSFDICARSTPEAPHSGQGSERRSMWRRLYPQAPHNPLPIFHLSVKIQRVPVTANKQPATADEMTGNHNQEGLNSLATNNTTTATKPGQNDACTSGSFSRRRTSRQIVGLIIESFPPLHARPEIFSLYVDKQTSHHACQQEVC